MSGQIHIVILNPGVEITPLRLRGWLQKEAAADRQACEPGRRSDSAAVSHQGAALRPA